MMRLMHVAVMIAGMVGGMGAAVRAQVPPDAPHPLPNPVTIKVGLAGKTEIYADGLLADALGELKKENISVEYALQKPSDGLVLLVTSRIDVLGTQPGSAIFNAVAGGNDLREVAQAGQSAPDNKQGFWIRKSLLDGKAFTPAMLKGLVIATPAGPGEVLDYWLQSELQKAELSLSDVKRKMLSSQDSVIALENGAIDVGFLFDGVWQKSDPSKIVFAFGGANITGGWLFGKTLLRDHPEIGQAFMRALIRTRVRALQGHYHDNPDVAPVLAKAIGLSVDQLRLAGGLDFPPSMPIPPNAAEVLQKTYMLTRGNLTYTKPLPFDQVFDRSFAVTAGAPASP